MTNQEMLAKIPADKCYEKIMWLITNYGKRFIQSSTGVIEWLEAEANEEDYKEKEIVFCKDCKRKNDKGYCPLVKGYPADNLSCGSGI